MPATPEEIAAANRLAAALVEFIAAVEKGVFHRHAQVIQRAAPAPIVETKWRPSQPVPVPPGLLTVRQAAKYMSIGARKLFDLTSPRGPIPVVRLGARLAYSVKDLEAAIERMKR